DYEGPSHAFGAGRQSGQATLDGIRAALSFEPLELAPEDPVGLWGYSGGAYASSWAAAVQPSYAPELNLAGSVLGGTPVDLIEITSEAENTDSFSLLFGLLFGVTRAYPEFLPTELLNEHGRQAALALKDSCVGVPTDGTTETGGRLADYFNVADPYQSAGFLSVAGELNLLRVPIYPASDIFIYHEVNDGLVPLDGTSSLVEHWCQAGVPINFYRNNTPAIPESSPLTIHAAGAALGTSNAIAYLDSRFRGDGAPVTPTGTLRCN
ncbi:MAG: hypothetical protein KBT72_05110, partial [Zhongshania sp.]|nr:hypothetical protein [Zhongshania sp.]